MLMAALAIALAACEVVNAPLQGSQAPAAQVEAPAQAPTAAPLPAPVLLQRALAARAAFDDDASAADLSALLQAHPASPEAVAARYYLAERYASRGRWSSAAELLRVFLAQADGADPLRPPALFWLARAQESAGDHAGAVAGYGAYRELGTTIAPYAAARQAAQEQALGNGEAAAASYLVAARSTIVRGERAGSFEKAIALLREAGRSAEALALYDELLALADRPDYRARILGAAAGLAAELGELERANAWLGELVATAPEAAEAAPAVDQLIAAGAPPAPADAARAYIGAERWPEAVAQLDAALAGATVPAEQAELGRLRGLALRAQGDFPGALTALAEAAARDPDGEAGREAQLAWVQTRGQNGETAAAIQGYLEYAAAYPDDPRAPIALDRVVQLHERLGDGASALQARLELGRRFPASDEGRAALHQAGLALFAEGRHGEARVAWQTLAEGNSGPWRARGAFWAGRAAEAYGDQQAARELFAAARSAAPTTYEGARAAEELGGLPQGNLPLGAPIDEAQWAELNSWVAGWAGSAPEAPAPQAELAGRAALLEAVGLQGEAIGEWLEGINANADAPHALAALARAAHEAGVPYAALMAAAALADGAPETAQAQPMALRRLLFPTPYPELVRREASERGVDPRLLYALIRQESLFNPGATSWVGARGLGQVMPETGQGIAQNLEVSDFQLDDLYRPAVSIRFGAFYLGRRIADMEGSVHGALAAYNGGLGNAQRWAGGSTVADPDRFTESIDFAETRGYVRAVYGFWGVYQGMYRP